MPEYSSTTITPADAIQLPAMNGSSGGNFTLASLKSYILSALGQANGIASLDGNGKLTSAQIPTDLDDVLVYTAYANYPATGVEGKLYIAKAEGTIHYWSGSAYVQINTPLSPTVTSGDTTHAPSGDAVYQKVLTEQTARENADSQLDKRVSNLEQKAGDYSETRYQNAPSGVVPTGKAKYAGLSVLRGVTRAWNQLVDTGTSTVTLTNGHKYLTYISGSFAIATGSGASISVTGGTDCVYDLTLLGATDTSSVASVLAQFPQLGQYNSYDAGSLVSNTISGFKSYDTNDVEIGSLSLPSSVTLRSAGSVSEEYYPESGRVTHPLYDYTFTGSELWVQWNAKCYYANCLTKESKDSYSTINCNASFALPTTADNLYNNGDTVGRAIACRSHAIYISVDMYNNRSELVGKTVTYTLATPDAPTQLDPVTDNLIKTESGGTLTPVQTQTPTIDTDFSVGFLAV